MRVKKATILLTTHSMTEAESLCNNKIGIVANGKFVCIGSVPELKSQFGNRYRVLIK